MPKIDIEYEVLDGIVVAGLKDMLNLAIEGYRDAQYDEDREGYAKDIAALEHVLGLYR
jgi:hypothetical protein